MLSGGAKLIAASVVGRTQLVGADRGRAEAHTVDDAASPGGPMTASYEPRFVTYERDGRVGVITIDRPPLNAYDDLLHWELEQAWLRAARDPEATVVVLRAGGKHFCAGADLTGEPLHRPTDAAPGMEVWEELDFIRNLMKPTIAAIQGGCIGGGQRFVFPCDLLFCSDDAFFRDPLAVMGGIGGIQSPVHTWLYGPRLAKEMLFGGERLPAERLYRSGAVNRIYPRHELQAATMDFAHHVAAGDALALRQAKRSVNTTMDIMGQHYIRNRFAELMDDAPTMRLRGDD
jgi:enoyl-CoA hydratase/carnithine racemase